MKPVDRKKLIDHLEATLAQNRRIWPKTRANGFQHPNEPSASVELALLITYLQGGHFAPESIEQEVTA